jgi:thiamine biosynthesis lipoprotein
VTGGAALDAADPVGDRLLRFEARAMASPLRLTIGSGVPERSAARAWVAVQAEFEACEQAMSRFRETSEVTQLNRAMVRGDQGPWPASVRLRRALVMTDRARRMTAGRFDPRVLRDLDRLGYRGASLAAEADDGSDMGPSGPTAAAVTPSVPTTDAGATLSVPTQGAATQAAPGSMAGGRPVVSLDRRGRVRLDAPVDLGGIGKGLALRWAATAATGLLPPGATGLIDAGGDIVTIGRREPSDPWPVGLEDPMGGSEELAVVAVAGGAVTTSSVAVNRWTRDDGASVHHLIDPTTGAPGGDGLLSVTVAGPDPAWSEIWSKALFLEGRASIGPLARRLGWPVWWVAADGGVELTPAARQRTLWLAREPGLASV